MNFILENLYNLINNNKNKKKIIFFDLEFYFAVKYVIMKKFCIFTFLLRSFFIQDTLNFENKYWNLL